MLTMNKSILLSCFISTALLGGCVYAPPPTYSSSTSSVSKFDRAWSAAQGAFSDQHVRITSESRGSGILEGTVNGDTVTANIRQQANGSVRVQFDTSDPNSSGSSLIERITQSYQRRMGR